MIFEFIGRQCAKIRYDFEVGYQEGMIQAQRKYENRQNNYKKAEHPYSTANENVSL